MKNCCPVSACSKEMAFTVVRIVLGIIFFMHGSQKVFGLWGGGGLTQTVQGMSSMGLPVVLVYLVCFTELLGGLGLIGGLLSRLSALGVGLVMVGAIVTVHLKNGFFLNWFLTPGVGHGFEYNLALVAMATAVILGGPGCWALDNLICKKEGGE